MRGREGGREGVERSRKEGSWREIEKRERRKEGERRKDERRKGEEGRDTHDRELLRTGRDKPDHGRVRKAFRLE